MKRFVAIKTLLPHLILHPTSLERFRQEAQAASNLAHPNIITIHEFGFTQEGQPYLVMDLLQGTSLSAFIRRDRYLPVDRACHIFVQIADALAHAHRSGVIHRDLKPSNILLIEKGEDPYNVQIVDFGIAKLLPQEGHESASLTQTGELFGSPLYMSPEQAKGEQLDPKSDVYSMGCLMYETLCGTPPHDGENTLDILYRHINQVPQPFSSRGVKIPNRLEMIVFKCLAKLPAQRYQSMEQLRNDLQDIMHERRASFIDRTLDAWTLFLLRRKPRSQRDRILVMVETLIVMLLVGIIGAMALLEWRAAESPASKQELTWAEDAPEQSQPPSAEDGQQSTNLDVGYRRFERGPEELTPEDTLTLQEKYMKFGTALVQQHSFELAADAFQKALKISKQYNGVRSFRTYMAWADYADALRRNGDANAPSVYQGLITEIERHSNVDDFFVYQLYKSQGDSFYALHNLRQAARCYEICLRHEKAATEKYALSRTQEQPIDVHFDPTDATIALDTTLTRSRLADCYFNMTGKPSYTSSQVLHLCQTLYYDCLKDWRRLRGNYSQDETVALYRLASVHAQLGQQNRADNLFQESLENSKKVFGEKSAYTGVLMRDYANFLWQTGRPLQSIYYKLCSLRVLAAAQ